MTKAHGVSGGGIDGNKNVRPGVKVGGRATAVPPGHAGRPGQQIVATKPLPQPAPMPAVKLGNEVALDVGGGGPSTGRKVMPSGSQGRHD
jgi:hypothetical protein